MGVLAAGLDKSDEVFQGYNCVSGDRLGNRVMGLWVYGFMGLWGYGYLPIFAHLVHFT
jgi:hypothetical protein